MFKKYLKDIIEIFEESTIEDIEISTFWGFRKIKLSKNDYSENITKPINKDNKRIVEKPHITKPDKELHETDNQESIEDSTITVLSPLVGTFYLSSKPDSPPFVSEGEIVKIGQTLCIVEAMKIFNEIESEFDGKVIKILVGDGTPIEFDQPLFILKK